jgi:Urocanase Rossmann-like domain
MQDERASITSIPFQMPSIARVRAHYGPLCAAAASRFGTASLSGRMLLVDGLAEEGDALLIAASIAGAGSLVLEARPEAVRYCVRNGIVDFAVRTLDEALRILKNEIRKQQPVAVLLESNKAGVLAEMVERGAQPDMIRWTRPDPIIEMLKQRGAQPAPPFDTEPEQKGNVCWSAGEGGGSVLRQVDLLVAGVLPQKDAERQNWIARAPRYLPRAMRLERCVTMSEAEQKALLAAAEERSQQGALASRVSIDIDGVSRSFS